jgi:hypothetical protein
MEFIRAQLAIPHKRFSAIVRIGVASAAARGDEDEDAESCERAGGKSGHGGKVLVSEKGAMKNEELNPDINSLSCCPF